MAKLREDLEVDDYYKECIDLEPLAINEELARYVGDLAYWSEKAAQANRALLQAEWAEEKVHAQLYLLHKEGRDGKKPTEAAVEAAIALDAAYQAAHEGVLAAQYEHDFLRGRFDTLRKKGEMLSQIAQQLRAEMGGDRRIMEREHARRVGRDGF